MAYAEYRRKPDVIQAERQPQETTLLVLVGITPDGPVVKTATVPAGDYLEMVMIDSVPYYRWIPVAEFEAQYERNV